MELYASAEKLKDGLYRILWNTNSTSRNNNSSSSFNYSSEVGLTSLGVDEYYNLACYMVKNRTNDTKNPVLKLTIETADYKTKNLKQRKVTARFLGYEKEMRFTPNLAEVDPSWIAQWTEITKIGCSFCTNRKGMAEAFEIFIDMDPTSSLKQAQQSVLSHITHLWESKTLADVTFKCEEREIKAHTIIISSASPVLAAMFQNDFKEQQEKIAVIKETKADVFERLLCFIYTGCFDFEYKDMSALLVAADMYNVDSLKEECEKCLAKNVTLEKATNYLILSYQHNAEKLLKATLKYMHHNSEAICNRPDWKSVIDTYPDLCFIAVQFMVKKNTSTSTLLSRMRQLRNNR